MKDVFTPIRWRLVGWNLLVLSAILLVLGWATYLALSRGLREETDRNLAAQATSATSRVEDDHREGRIHVEGAEGGVGNLFFLIVGPDGQVVSNPRSVNLDGGASRLHLTNAPHYEDGSIFGEPVRLYLQPIRGGSQDALTLVVGQSVQAEKDILATLLLVLLVGSGVGLALSLIGAWFLAGRALVPIQEAFRRQQQFIADASHELRTPLTVLHAATDLLSQHSAEPLEANAGLLQDVRGEIGRMERLVGDLLTLARSDLGEIDLATGELDLRLVAGEVVRLVGPLAERKGILLETRADGDTLPVEADPDRLQQLLLILLDNALKHTPSGGKVSVVSMRRGSMGCVEVVDTGPGIPREQLPKLFDRFYRLEKARSRGQGGAGLGLSIAKSLAEAHGGQLTLESTPGAGTTARLCLKLQREGGRAQGQA